MADVRRLVELSMVPPLAKEVAAQIDAASGGSVAWDSITGTQAGVEDAVAAKTEIAALAALSGTVGTANDAMTAVPAAVAALTGADTATLPTLVSVNASVTAINNNLADLQAKVNAVMAALKA